MLKLQVRTRLYMEPEFAAGRNKNIPLGKGARQQQHYLPRPADDQGRCGKKISRHGHHIQKN